MGEKFAMILPKGLISKIYNEAQDLKKKKKRQKT